MESADLDELNALFSQVVVGDLTNDQAAGLDREKGLLLERKRLRGVSTQEAMRCYIDKVETLILEKLTKEKTQEGE